MWRIKVSHVVSKKEPSGIFLFRISVGKITHLDCHAHMGGLKDHSAIPFACLKTGGVSQWKKGFGGFKV
jgi:hypothetical protein